MYGRAFLLAATIPISTVGLGADDLTGIASGTAWTAKTQLAQRQPPILDSSEKVLGEQFTEYGALSLKLERIQTLIASAGQKVDKSLELIVALNDREISSTFALDAQRSVAVEVMEALESAKKQIDELDILSTTANMPEEYVRKLYLATFRFLKQQIVVTEESLEDHSRLLVKASSGTTVSNNEIFSTFLRRTISSLDMENAYLGMQLDAVDSGGSQYFLLSSFRDSNEALANILKSRIELMRGEIGAQSAVKYLGLAKSKIGDIQSHVANGQTALSKQKSQLMSAKELSPTAKRGFTKLFALLDNGFLIEDEVAMALSRLLTTFVVSVVVSPNDPDTSQNELAFESTFQELRQLISKRMELDSQRKTLVMDLGLSLR